MSIRRPLPAVLAGLLLGSGCDHPATTPPPAAPPAEVSIAAPPPPPPAPAKKPARYAAADMTFDGFKLGADYGKLMTRPPYNDPCDDDPIDHKARRFMVYGALPCRDRTFPEATTVAFYLRFAEGPTQFNQPIEAFAWLGGGYFSTRSDFPLRTGAPASDAAETLGPPLKTFSLQRRKSAITVQRHEGDISVLIDDGKLVGFVVGPMPDDPESEQWRGLMQMYDRYTDHPVVSR